MVENRIDGDILIVIVVIVQGFILLFCENLKIQNFLFLLEHLHSFWKRKGICKIDWCVLCKCMISWLNPTKYKIFNIHLIQNVNIFASLRLCKCLISAQVAKLKNISILLDISDFRCGWIVRAGAALTSHEHEDNGKYLFIIRVGRHIAEADWDQTGETKVKTGAVAALKNTRTPKH